MTYAPLQGIINLVFMEITSAPVAQATQWEMSVASE